MRITWFNLTGGGVMKQLEIKVVASLIAMIILSISNFSNNWLLLVLIGSYGLFKAMDLYHDVKRIK